MPPRKLKTFQQARATIAKKQMVKLTNAKVSRAMVVNKQEVQRRKIEKAEKEEKQKQAREKAEASAVVGSSSDYSTKRTREGADAAPKSPSPVENLDDMFPRAPDAEPKAKKRRISGGSEKTEKMVEEPAAVPDNASEAVAEPEKERRSSATDNSTAKTKSPSSDKAEPNAAHSATEHDAVAKASESNTTAAANASSTLAIPNASPIPLRRLRIPPKTNSALMPSPARRKRPAPSPIAPGRAPPPTTVKTRMGELIELGPASPAASSPGAPNLSNGHVDDGPSRWAYVPSQAQKRVQRMNRLIAESRRSYGNKGARRGQGGTRAG